ncbi:hypothetical protein RHMOL_Rhmol07G0309500 [Rhododendron molle]|uniref:Uncharacterized protein n=1 Tax=Rhododendron molle TaxID=49168 RepID=A0ACC0N735_RHOML|nr:hypothetical protein RHMOL_Rhmol07G0309500 [Rhododendron molle]
MSKDLDFKRDKDIARDFLPNFADANGEPKYMKTLVLRLNKCFALDELRICFSLDKEFSQAIDEWIDVAITKRVPKLELNLSSPHGYFGPKIKLLVLNVPHLVELSYKGGIAECLHDFLNQVSCYLPQLRALTWSFAARLMQILEFGAYPKLVKLKELVLNILIGRDDESLLGYVSLIEASPHLERCVLKLEWETHPTINGGEARSSVKCSHKYLKVVEMAGYYGGTSDFALAMYFIENAVALDKVVIDPCCQYSHWIRSPESTKCDELAGRSRACRQFQGKVPMGVELVLL